MGSLTRSTLIITAFSTAGLALGFLVNLVVAARFGAGSEMDVYLAATTLPAFLSAILMGPLSTTFLPVFAEYREKDVRDAWKIVSAFLNLSLLASAACCAAAMIFAEPITRAMAPGFDPDQVRASASLLRWLLPSVAFTVVNELISSIYFSNKRFVEPMAIKVLAPLLTIAYVLAFSSSLSLRSVVLATLTAGFVQTAILAVGLFRDPLFHYMPSLDFRHPGVRRILGLMVPIVLGMLIYRLVPAFERWFASDLGTGAISRLGYAMRLVNSLQPILITGISVTGFALMSELASKRDIEGLRAVMSKNLAMLAFLSVPCAVLLGGFGTPLVGLLFERGAFTSADTAATGLAFALYVASLPASTMGTVISQGFYAFQDTRTPAVVGIAEIAVYVGLCLALAAPLGMASIPASYTLYFYLSCLALGLLVVRKTGFAVLPLAIRPALHGLASSAAALGCGLLLARLVPDSRIWAVTCMGLSFGAYFLIQKTVFRRPEADAVVAMVLRKLPRKG